jgi:hypothetical protein
MALPILAIKSEQQQNDARAPAFAVNQDLSEVQFYAAVQLELALDAAYRGREQS